MPPTLTEERPTTEERVSRIEGVLPHLATKADVAELRADLTVRIAEVETRLAKQIAESETRIVRWIIASVSLAVAIVTVINRVMG